MSKISKKSRDKKNIEHEKYISRITKTLYYGKFPKPDELSLPVTELAAEVFSETRRGRSIDRLHYDDAAIISRNACVSPCSLIVAMLYLEKLKKKCPDYLERTISSDLFLVSLMVSCKFLYDDGEEDEVFLKQWAASGGISVKQLIQLEKDFLKAMDWEIFVNELTFWKKMEELEKTLAKKQGIARGFFTYTELQKLAGTLELHNLIQNALTMSVILIATYTAAVLALFASAIIVKQIPGTCLQSSESELERNVIIPLVCDSSVNNTAQRDLSQFDLDETLETHEKRNVQNVSWDWWSAPTLRWLYETAMTQAEISSINPTFYENFSKDKYMDAFFKTSCMEDQLQKAWYTEGTDTIHSRYLHQNLLNIKS